MFLGKGPSLSSGVGWVVEGKPEALPVLFNIGREIWLRMAFLTMSLEQLDPTIPETNNL